MKCTGYSALRIVRPYNQTGRVLCRSGNTAPKSQTNNLCQDESDHSMAR